VFEHALAAGQLPRFTGDTIAVGPPFISTPDEIAKMADDLRKAIRASF
jgi:beta-alanine--pyruvate transaminase